MTFVDELGVIGNHDIPKWSDYEQVLNTHYNGHGAGMYGID